MRVCRHCEGFVPDTSNQCPNCEFSIEPLKKKGPWSKIFYGLTASSVAMTLMACYGQPPCRGKCQEQRDERTLLILLLEKQSETNSNTNKNNKLDTKTSEVDSDDSISKP